MKEINTKNTRLILFHKHPASARLQFLRFHHGGVCGFQPLPKLASLIEQDTVDATGLVVHPSTITNWGEQQLDLQPGDINAETEFCERVEVPHGNITVYLAGFKGYETPHDKLARYEAKFSNMMECIGMPPVEMLLLQKAYKVIMGG